MILVTCDWHTIWTLTYIFCFTNFTWDASKIAKSVKWQKSSENSSLDVRWQKLATLWIPWAGKEGRTRKGQMFGWYKCWLASDYSGELMMLLLLCCCHRSHLRVTHHTLEAGPGVSDIIILHTHVSLWRIELDCKLINWNRDTREPWVNQDQVS